MRMGPKREFPAALDLDGPEEAPSAREPAAKAGPAKRDAAPEPAETTDEQLHALAAKLDQPAVGVPFLTASRKPWKLGLRPLMVLTFSPLAISSEITAVYARSPNKCLRWSFGF